MIPRLAAPDSSLSFLRDGYTFGARRFDRLDSDAFRTRLMFKRALLMRGADASRMFYEGHRFTRTGALPPSVVHLLQDEGSVQALDGDEHDHRKLVFLAALRAESAAHLVSVFRTEWESAVDDWGRADQIELHSSLRLVLTRAAASWAGVPLSVNEAEDRANELGAMIENAGTFGPSNWAARSRRNLTEEWARSIIERTRSGDLQPPVGSALQLICAHVDANGVPLDTATAAIELINVLRPIVAVGRFIVFAALALHRHPRWATALATDDADLENFVNEVRRFYPFFPVVGGRATTSFDWDGNRFEAGDWVLLDLYATNHDESTWDRPYRFSPERFRDWRGDPNTLIPQGGGDFEHGHRCPGEPVTNELMKEAVRLLTRRTVYSVPDQDLRVSLRHIPAIPESRFLMRVAASAV